MRLQWINFLQEVILLVRSDALPDVMDYETISDLMDVIHNIPRSMVLTEKWNSDKWLLPTIKEFDKRHPDFPKKNRTYKSLWRIYNDCPYKRIELR